jgi:CheY-like chemotaxis protein
MSSYSNLDKSNNDKSILIVDDEYDVANLIKQSLQMNRRKVSVFTDRVMALEDFRVNCKTCSVILSDIRMPGMNGYELIRKIKEIDKQVKVILMSAFEIQGKEFPQSTARYQSRWLPSKAIFPTKTKPCDRENDHKKLINLNTCPTCG